MSKNKIDLSQILIGSDFEMFLVDKNTGKVKSAIPFNVGTKKDPEVLDRNGCCIQRDGVLQECNVPPVGIDDSEEFIDNVEYVKNYVRDTIKGYNLKLVCCASNEVDDDQLQEPEAREFGCSPDYNAWTEEINEKPEPTNSNLRSCGGHLHFSYPDANYDTSLELIKLCDLFLGLPFSLIDKDTRRRELYGKAGCFRMCDWGNAKGFEYRVLSNKWIDDPELIEYLFHQIKQMFNYYNENGIEEVMKDQDTIIKAINESDEDAAYEICEKYNIHLILEYV